MPHSKKLAKRDHQQTTGTHPITRREWTTAGLNSGKAEFQGF